MGRTCQGGQQCGPASRCPHAMGNKIRDYENRQETCPYVDEVNLLRSVRATEDDHQCSRPERQHGDRHDPRCVPTVEDQRREHQEERLDCQRKPDGRPVGIVQPDVRDVDDRLTFLSNGRAGLAAERGRSRLRLSRVFCRRRRPNMRGSPASLVQPTVCGPRAPLLCASFPIPRTEKRLAHSLEPRERQHECTDSANRNYDLGARHPWVD